MSKRRKIERYLIVIALVVFAVLSVTYAFFQAQISDGASQDVDIITKTTDSLIFDVGDEINLSINQFNFGVDDGNLTDNTTASATLLANNDTNSANYTYYVYFKINTNEYVYTTTDQKPEIILTIEGPDGEITSIEGLTYDTDLGGFDITTASGIYAIASDYPITSVSSTESTVQNWEFTVTFINLETNQGDNAGKSMNAEVILQQEKLSLILTEYIMSLYTEDGVNGLYYHDADLENGAGDNSYRYAGASADVRNYVCFGYNTTDDCSDVDYLYRIIGIFDDGDGYQVKLIKADYATTSLVGTNGEYVRIYASYSNYQGDLNLSDIGAYYWWSGDDGTNTWSDSALNTVNLNENFLTNIGTNWSNLIAYHYWRVGGMSTTYGMYSNAQTAYNYEVGSYASGTTHSAKIGLMYVSDYYYAAEPTYWTYPGYSSSGSSYDYRAARDYNWMYMGLWEWTITPVGTSITNIFWVNYTGYTHNSNPADGNRVAIRPAFYLESSVEITGGSGTKENPYRIA